MTRYPIPRIHGISTKRSPNRVKLATMPSTDLLISGRERQEFGYIVTAREQSTDARWVLHRAGAGALVEICETLDDAEGEWRVLTISTPATIYKDLQGTRKSVGKDVVEAPERSALGKIKRMDLLDPVYHPAIPDGRSHF